MEAVDFSLLSRINRDIQDALIVLDMKGNIIYSNPAASQLLGIKLSIGTKYAALIASENNEKNDAFHQYLLDSIYDKQSSHGGELEYTRSDGVKRAFHVLTSFLFGDDGTEKMGVVIQFSDITELAKTHKLHRNTAYLFISLLGVLSFFNFFTVIWQSLGKPFASSLITLMIEIVGFTLAFIMYRDFDVTLENMGFRIRGCGKYIAIDSLATAAILCIMMLVKYFLRHAAILPSSEPFLHWELWNKSMLLYPVTVVMQEILTRSLIHEWVTQVVPAKHAELTAIVISSLFFGAIHLFLGLGFMVGSALLLSLFGIVYSKQRCIWALCIPHYFLGMSLTIIWGM